MMPMRLIRSHEVRLLFISSVAAAISVTALLITLVVRANQNQQYREQVADNCIAVEAIKEQIRGVFEDNLASVERRNDLDAVQRRAIVDYYTRQIKRFKPLDCPSA